MNDIMDLLSGVDKKNEIFNLWYEVTFLRLILNHVIMQIPGIDSTITDEIINQCRQYAQNVVQEKFPAIKIDFSEPSEEKKEKNKHHLERLRMLNDLMGRNITSDSLGGQGYTHPSNSESPSSCHPPLNAE